MENKLKFSYWINFKQGLGTALGTFIAHYALIVPVVESLAPNASQYLSNPYVQGGIVLVGMLTGQVSDVISFLKQNKLVK